MIASFINESYNIPTHLRFASQYHSVCLAGWAGTFLGGKQLEAVMFQFTDDMRKPAVNCSSFKS